MSADPDDEVVDLTSSPNAGAISTDSLPRIPNSLSRRYRQGGATFTANRHGVFEPTTKRRKTDILTNGHKKARLESTRKSIHYDAVYQHQRAVKKHIIVRRHAKFYILRCDQHDISFDDNPFLNSKKHLREDHGITATGHDTVIKHFGVEVIECDDAKLEQNNAVAEKALQDGTNALAKDAINVTDSANMPKSPQAKRNCPERPILKLKSNNSRNTMRSNRRKIQNDEDVPLNLVPGNVYIIWWFETQQWFAGLLMPHQNLEAVGIHKPFEQLPIFKTIPACYQYDTSSKSLSWAKDFEDGGPKASERYYPFIFFEGFQFPEKCHQAWIQLDNIQPWDDEKSAYIEHRAQAVRFLKEQRERKKRKSKAPITEAETPESIDNHEPSQNAGSRDSDRDENSDVYELRGSSPLAESSTDNQAVPESNIATPDTINDPETVAELGQKEATPDFENDDAMILEQLDGSDQEMVDADQDMDEPPQSEVPELSVQQERVPKDPDPDQTIQTSEPPTQSDGEMDLITIEDTTESEQEHTQSVDDILEEPEVAATAKVLRSGNDEAQTDILMTEPSDNNPTTREPSEGNIGTTTEIQYDTMEETQPVNIPGTDRQSVAESEHDGASQQSDPAHSNEKPQSTSRQRPDQNRWTDDDRRRIINGPSPDRTITEGVSSGIDSTTKPVSVQKPAAINEPASTPAPEQDIDLDSLLTEGENLELHMSQTEPATQQHVESYQTSPTSSDDNRLAHDLFNAIMSEDRQLSTPRSSPHMNHSNPDTLQPRAEDTDMGQQNSVSSPQASEERSQPSPYAQMGTPASLHSRPASKSSNLRQPSYDETGTPASVIRQLSATRNATRHHSNDEMGRRMSVSSRPSTRNGDISQQHRDAETGQPTPTAGGSNKEFHSRDPPSIYQITSSQPRSLSRELDLPPQANETAMRESPVMSQPDTRTTSEATPVQMPLRGPETDQNPPERPTNWLQQVVASPPQSHAEGSQSNSIPFETQATAPSQQSTNVSIQENSVPQYSDTAPLPEMDSSQSLPTSDQYQTSVDQSSYQPAIADPQPIRETRAFSPSQLPSATQQSARDILRVLAESEESGQLPRHNAPLPPSGDHPSPDASLNSFGQQDSSATFRTPTMGNSHTFQEAMPSPRQPVMQHPLVPYRKPSAPQVMPSPRLSNASISRSSSLSQGYTVPPHQPLPSPYQLAGELPRPVSNTENFRAQPSPHQPAMELQRAHTATYVQPRPNTTVSTPYTTTSLPPPSTLAQGPPMLQVSASPRLQAMEISRPSSAVQDSRTPTSPRQYAMRFTQPVSTVHGAPLDTALSPRMTLGGPSRPGSFVQGQSSTVNASPQLAAREISRPSSAMYGQRTLPAMPSPRQAPIAIPQSMPPAHGRVHQPFSISSPQVPAAQLPRYNSASYSQSGPPAMTSPLQSTVSGSQPGLVAPPLPAMASPHILGATAPPPTTVQGMQAPEPTRISSRPGQSIEPPRTMSQSSSNGPLPPLQPRGSNYIPASQTHRSHSPPAQTRNDTMDHSRRHSRTSSQSYSYRGNPQTSNSTPRSHAPAYQVPVQRPNPAQHSSTLHDYLPRHVVEALIEQTGRRDNDLKPRSFLNYQTMYECPFCRAGMPEQAVFVQHLQRLCPYIKYINDKRPVA
ncbi:hypothetical protein ACHAP4_003639 [Fusarium culmorum]